MRIEWIEAELPSAGEHESALIAPSPDALAGLHSVPELVVCKLFSDDAPAFSPKAAKRLTNRALELVKAFLKDERFDDSKLVLITKGALAKDKDEDPDLIQARFGD